MAYCFGDSFDLYAVTGDSLTGYWDSGTLTFATFVAGRFGGQAYSYGATGANLVKSSGANDAIHHIVCAVKQSTALTGATLGMYLQLSDGATNQVCIVFRSDGAILLTSATPAGTVLATYTGATTLLNQWFAYEFEVVIHPTAGRFRVRKNNNTSDDFDSGATLNTRPGANSYANKLTFGTQSTATTLYTDDLLWRSDASSVPFVGDIRTYVRMPVSDVQKQFLLVGSASLTFPTASVSSGSTGATNTTGFFTQVTPTYTGLLATAIYASTTAVGNAKCCLFADNAGAPGAIIKAADAPVALTGGSIVFSFTAATLTRGVPVWLAIIFDTTPVVMTSANSSSVFGGKQLSTSYAAFPQASPVTTIPNFATQVQITYTPNANWAAVSEAQQDSATSYVYSSNVGDTDLYGIAPIAVTPVGTVAVTTRAFVSKSDAGSRSGKVLLKSGASTVDSGSATLATTWAQMWRTDTVDPATGVAWTPTGVNSVNIGFSVTA